MTTGPLAIINDGDVIRKMDGKEYFDTSVALAYLLAEEICCTASRKDDGSAAILVHCSDTFAWAVSEFEPLPTSEIRSLYEMVRKDRALGADVWACQRRKMMPQKPVADAIRKNGIWQIDEMGLEPNRYDEACRQAAEERRAKEAAA